MAREQEARTYGGYFCFDRARTLLGDTGPERPDARGKGYGRG
ncbi:hypothetical protein ACWY4P_18100 [Streptomyces sp. LZ34]